MSQTQALRSSILQQVDTLGTKRRFGLFSQPISTAIGDDGLYKTKIHPRNQMGKPVTEPRNFYTNPTKKGQLEYFEPLKALATSDKKDIFIEESRRLLRQQNEAYNHNRKQTNFVPGSGYKTITNSAYKYKQENNPQLDPKRFRQQDGKVKSQPRNFYTNSITKVDKQFFKTPAYIPDPYDRKHNLQVELHKKAKAKQGQAAFRPNNFVPKVLNSDRKTYQLNVQINKKPQKEPKLNIYTHEAPFRRSNPAKTGLDGFIAPFPKYIEDPPKQIKRKDTTKQQKQSFRSMSLSSSKPSPSITMMSVKRSFHHSSFSRR